MEICVVLSRYLFKKFLRVLFARKQDLFEKLSTSGMGNSLDHILLLNRF